MRDASVKAPAFFSIHITLTILTNQATRINLKVSMIQPKKQLRKGYSIIRENSLTSCKRGGFLLAGGMLLYLLRINGYSGSAYKHTLRILSCSFLISSAYD